MKTKILIPLLVFVFLLAACGGKPGALSLAGTSWVLERINGQPIVENTAPTLTFRNEKETGGNASCNSFGGDYEARDGKLLTFGPLFSTLMACLEPGVMEQESAYLAALESAAAYRVESGKLLISDASGAVVLVFSPQDTSLEGKAWSLTAFNNGQNLVSVLPDTQINVEFKDANISGTSGCNRYSGSFQQNGQKLTFDPLVSTEMYCGEPAGVMEQETAYLNALSKVARYTIDGNRLTLFDADGLRMAEFAK